MTAPKRRRRYPAPQPPVPPPPPGAAADDEPAGEAEREGEGKQPERLFVISGDGERVPLDLVTLIVARAEAPSRATPEQTAVLRMCAAPLSVAEISAYLRLPFSVVTVLITDLLTARLVQARAPIVRQQIPDRSLLEAVMHGLQRL
ncbi:DUF742 domain-containing protein [Streptomyces galbus]|uniref:DUF742 domain-containing protein n=1 Tax=Streptomyces galbus TaxID=33898 RepID=A0A4U5WXU7_STRGB|nr:DUF742 domain-containing protein [Streptomyces galbus]NKQ26390.1 DUF742 domain-containing protein [Streptomyces galbus]TKT07418.1 DUF742 domain-containing protein [Streptomyces galbus]GHD36959.1 hypothetical protein GCM10010335_33640 [Streptomyces galbus]